MILLVDNYDSFSWNLAHLFGALGADVVVRRNDELDADEAERLAPSHLVVSPGPGRPALVEVCGGEVGYARELVHGKASPVRHDGSGLFEGLPDPFEAGRYHSLAATRLPDVLEPTAFAEDGEVMAVRHRELPVDGVQFHPESVLTPVGRDLARNFLGAA